MAKRFPFRTAIAGVTALAVAAPVIAPANFTTLSAAIAHAQQTITVNGPDNIAINTAGEFTASVPGATSGSVQFYLDGVAVDGLAQVGAGGIATKSITPTTYATSGAPHTVTARYIDGQGFNPNPDGTKTFTTPVDVKPKDNIGEDSEVYSDFRVGTSPSLLAVSSLNDPVIIEAGTRYTLRGNMRIDGGASRVYEVGLNPPKGSTYVDGTAKRHGDSRFGVTSLGTDNGTIRKLNPWRGITYPSWGTGDYPKINAGYVGMQSSRDYNASNNETYDIEAQFVAPTTPGVYVPQYASYKYRSSTHVLERMDEAAFRVPAQRLPDRNEPKGPVAQNTTITLSGDTVKTDKENAQVTATIDPAAAGSVRFYADNTPLTAAPVEVRDGKAVLDRTFEPGVYEIRADFTPADATKFNASKTTEAHTLTVNASEINTTTAYTGDLQGAQNQDVTLRAKVDPVAAQGSPAAVTNGTVTFRSGNTVLADNVPVNNGVAETTYAFSSGGTQPVIAEYVPAADSNLKGSKSDAADVVISSQTTTTLTASNENPTVNSPVTLTATVTPQLATGKVEFWDKDANEKLGESQVNNGTATYSYTPTTTGAKKLEARFVPEGGNNEASTSNELVVTAKAYETTVSLNEGQRFTAGQAGPLTATVSPNNAQGKVVFSDSTKTLGEATVENGVATLPNATFGEAGTPTVTVTFVPAENSNFAENTGSGTVQVTKAAEGTTVTLTGNASVPAGQSAEITATVTPSGAAGKVRFYEGDTELGVEDVTDGTATLNREFAAGDHTVRAEFVPNDQAAYTPSQTTESFTFNVAPATVSTTTTWDPQANKDFVRGTNNDMVALVKDGNGNPVTEGWVRFILDGTALSPIRTLNNEGKAVYDKTFGAEGISNLVLEYIPPVGSNLEASKSGTIELTTRTETTTKLSASSTNPRVGTPVTLTASIDPKETAGKVHFIEVDAAGNEEKVGEATPVKGGSIFNSTYTATYNYTPATPGAKKVVARFVPSGQFVSGSEATADLNVQANAASLSLVDAQPFVTGQQGSLSARIIPSNAPGEIEFIADGESLGTAPIENGIATLDSVTFDTAGDKTITVKYVPAQGSTYAAPDATGTVTVKDPAGASTVTLTGPATATAGDEVTLTATPGPAGTAGQVRFFEGETTLDTVDVTDGKAELTHAFDTAGDHVVGAEFIPAPDANMNRSAPAFHTIKVERQMMDTSVAYVGPKTSPAGQKLDMVAEVKDAQGNPVTEGKVRFMLDGKQIGEPQAAKTTGPNAGKFVFDKTFSQVKVENLTLEYLPVAGSQYKGSTSTETTEILIQGTTTTSISATNKTPAVGTPVPLTANVAPATVGGTVEFFDVTDPGNEVKVGETQTLAGGRASVSYTPDNTAPKKFEARFTPNANTYTGSKSTQLEITPQAIGTNVELNANQTFTAGEAGPLSARVTPSNQGGTVEFFRGNSTAENDKIGEAKVVDGTATLESTTFNQAGDPIVTVRFTPDNANYKPSQNVTGTVKVNPAPVSTKLNLTGPATATEGDEVTLTATVDPAAAGQVRFIEGDNTLATVDVNNGKAELKREFAPGQHTVRAEFVPANASEFLPSQTTDAHTFNVTAKSEVTLEPNQTFTATVEGPLTARVTPADAAGSVEFFLGNDSLGTANVNNGLATVPNAAFPDAGEQTVRVVFTPAAGSNLAKSENTGTVTVNELKVAAQTSIELSGPATSNTDDEVTITAKVSPINAAGTVQFYNNGTALGTAKDVTNGEATLTQKFAQGTHSITAKFTPTDAADFTASETQNAHALKVEQAKVDTTIQALQTETHPAGQKSYMRAKVTDAQGNPVTEGTVRFSLNGGQIGQPQPLNSEGISVFDKSFGEPGNHTVKVEYLPPANSRFNASDPSESTFEIKANETTTTLSVSNASPAVGSPVFLNATVTPNIQGTIGFYDVTDPQNPQQIGKTVTVNNGKATTQYTPKTLGEKKVEARFTPTGTNAKAYAASKSMPVTTITPQALNAMVGLIDGQTFTVGQPNNLTASVSPNNATGTVEFFDVDNNKSLGTADVVNGVATKDEVVFTTPAESKKIAVKFTPTEGSNFAPKESEGTIKVVKAAENTSVKLTGPATATDGQEVTITAEVSPAEATGQVRFFEGNNELATVDVANGTAELKRSFTAGEHQIRAEFLPANTADYTAAQTTDNHVLNVDEVKIGTTVTYTGPTEGTQGVKLWMKAKVAPQTGDEVINSGTVIFKLDGQQIGDPQPVRNGEATFDKTFTEAKIENLTLEFVPANGSKFLASTMDTAANILIKATSTTTLSASNTAPTVGTPVTLTANVTPNNAAGRVVFYDVTGGRNEKLGEGDVTGGRATHTLTPANTTPVEVEARFVPATAGTVASTSNKLTISPVAVGTSVALEGDTTFTVDEPGTLTARVTPDNAEGTVEFLDGAQSLGTAEVENGTATLANVSFDTAADNKTITVKFTPSNQNFAAKEGTGQIDVVAKKVAADTTIALNGDNAVKADEEASITATVTAGTDPVTAGTVRFYEGTSLLGTEQVGNDGKATLSVKLPVGEHTIRAEFTPADATEFNESQTADDAAHTLTVSANQFETTTTYTGATEGKKGKPVTLKAEVKPQGSNDPVNSGKVVFRHGNTVKEADVKDGVAETTHTFTLGGTQTVTVEYVPADGNTTYLPSRAADAKILIKADTTTTLTASNENPTIGTPVTLTATVSPQLSDGNVTFWDVTDAANPQQIGNPMRVANNKATFNYTPEDTTPRRFEARFAPSQASNNASKSDQVTVTGQKQNSTVKLTDGQSFTAGQEGTLTARVTPTNAKGTVTFYKGDSTDDADKLGEAQVGDNGIASIKATLESAGDQTITAVFTPEGNVLGGDKATGTVKVVKAAENTKVELTGDTTKNEGEEATITATVTPNNAAGKVRFLEGDRELARIDVTAGTAELKQVFAPGEHTIRAEFIPNDRAAFNASATAADAAHALTVTATPPAVKETTTTIEGPATGNVGEPKKTYTATVKDADGNPVTGGKVEFYSNDYKMGEAKVENGTASVEYAFVIPGKRDVVAVFTPADGANLEGSKSTPIVAMMKEDAKVTLAAPTETVNAGEPVTLTATVSPQLAEGTVEFYDNQGTKLGEAKVDNGRATGTVTPKAGTNTVEARFVPAENSVYNGGTSDSVDITAQNAKTTVTVTEGQTFEAGVPGDLTARVTPTNAKGEVVFHDTHPETGEYRELRAPVINGTAVLKGIRFESPIETRTVNVKFVPAPGSGFEGSNNTGTVTVKVKSPEAADTTLTLTASENPTADKATTVFATVTPTDADGIVEIYDGRELLDTANVTGGRAELPIRLAEGTHNLRGEFIPADAATHKPTSQTIEVKVGAKPQPPAPKPAAKTSLSLNATKGAKAGDTVTVTATTNPTNAEGEIEFFNGTQSLGTKPVANGSATANFTPENAGSYTVKAVFTPKDAAKFERTEETTTVTVTAKETKPENPVTPEKPVIENVDVTGAKAGDPVTLRATLSGVKAGQKVRFLLTDGTVLGTGTVDGNEIAVLRYEFDKPGAYAVQAQLIDASGTPTGLLSDPYLLTIASKEKSGSSDGSSDGSAKTPDASSLTGPNRPWVITGIVVAVTALVAGVGSFFLNIPQVRDFLAQFGIRY